MQRNGIRIGMLVGLLLGFLAALIILLMQAGWIPLLAEAVLAVVAGAVAAHFVLGMRVPAMVAGPGGMVVRDPRGLAMRNAVAAGAVVGILAGVALSAVAYMIIDSSGFQEQVQSLMQQQGGVAASGSPTSILLIAKGCVGCFYIVFIGAITAGLGALGGWLYGLRRPAPAAPPPPPPLPPLPPMPPGGSDERAG
jgi:hypothetical protein